MEAYKKLRGILKQNINFTDLNDLHLDPKEADEPFVASVLVDINEGEREECQEPSINFAKNGKPEDEEEETLLINSINVQPKLHHDVTHVSISPLSDSRKASLHRKNSSAISSLIQRCSIGSNDSGNHETQARTKRKMNPNNYVRMNIKLENQKKSAKKVFHVEGQKISENNHHSELLCVKMKQPPLSKGIDTFQKNNESILSISSDAMKT